MFPRLLLNVASLSGHLVPARVHCFTYSPCRAHPPFLRKQPSGARIFRCNRGHFSSCPCSSATFWNARAMDCQRTLPPVGPARSTNLLPPHPRRVSSSILTLFFHCHTSLQALQAQQAAIDKRCHLVPRGVFHGLYRSRSVVCCEVDLSVRALCMQYARSPHGIRDLGFPGGSTVCNSSSCCTTRLYIDVVSKVPGVTRPPLKVIFLHIEISSPSRLRLSIGYACVPCWRATGGLPASISQVFTAIHSGTTLCGCFRCAA
jgi:hypothetical protein